VRWVGDSQVDGGGGPAVHRAGERPMAIQSASTAPGLRDRHLLCYQLPDGRHGQPAPLAASQPGKRVPTRAVPLTRRGWLGCVLVVGLLASAGCRELEPRRVDPLTTPNRDVSREARRCGDHWAGPGRVGKGMAKPGSRYAVPASGCGSAQYCGETSSGESPDFARTNGLPRPGGRREHDIRLLKAADEGRCQRRMRGRSGSGHGPDR
jgi:hypothetical protein